MTALSVAQPLLNAAKIENRKARKRLDRRFMSVAPMRWMLFGRVECKSHGLCLATHLTASEGTCCAWLGGANGMGESRGSPRGLREAACRTRFTHAICCSGER